MSIEKTKMPQITGSQIGNAQNNSFIGELDSADVVASPLEAAINNASIRAAAGDDIIEGRVSLVATETVNTITGLKASEVRGGSGQDTVLIRAEAAGAPATAKGVDTGLISGGWGRDTITVEAFTRGSTSTAFGVIATQIWGGADNDTITISSKSRGVSTRFAFLGDSDSFGVTQGSVIGGGAGDDVIDITASAQSSESAAYGVMGSRINGGSGADTIKVEASSGGFGPAISFGLLDANLNGGEGDDAIEVIVAGANNTDPSTSVAVKNSAVRGGGGNDKILLRGFGNSQSSRSLLNAKIYGDSGNDTIEVQGLLSTDYNIEDSLIFGGAGDDSLDIGIGSGTVNGGAGNDSILLDYFDAATMDIGAIANGIKIVGSQTRNGEAGEWTQEIVNVENYSIDGTIYTADTISELFSA